MHTRRAWPNSSPLDRLKWGWIAGDEFFIRCSRKNTGFPATNFHQASIPPPPELKLDATFRILRKLPIYSVHASLHARFESDAAANCRKTFRSVDNFPRHPFNSFPRHAPAVFTFEIHLKASPFPDERLFAFTLRDGDNGRIDRWFAMTQLKITVKRLKM